MQAIQGSGSAPAVSVQLGVGGQLLVAVANTIQIAPQQQANDLDSQNVITLARYCYCSLFLTEMKWHQNETTPT